MSAENSADHGAEGGGEDLRARYLPVSRKELRRRREEDLAAQREAQEQAEAAADALAAEDTTEVPEAGEPTQGAATEGVPHPAEDDGAQEPVTETEAPTAAIPVEEEPGEPYAGGPVGEPLEESGDQSDDAHDDGEADSSYESSPSDVLIDEDEEEAPVPASRRARRLLQETGRLEALTDERLSEIDEITRQAAAVSAEDPNKVDPELLKKQQALAAKAMQENQQRRRREQEEAAREERRRRHQRPESEVITRKALRAYADTEEEHRDLATGEIDPVEASGAHGLELDGLVEQTSRQASRQSLMLWLVIVLAVLLVIAIGLVLYFVL